MKKNIKILVFVITSFFFVNIASALVIISVSPPSATINQPTANVTVPQNQSVLFSGTGTYPPCTIVGCQPNPPVTGYQWREGVCSTGTLLSSAASFNLTTPTTGSRRIYFRVANSNGWSTNCPSRLVTITAVGTVNVSSNVSSSWTITGPSTIIGSGTSQSSSSKPAGTYTITWNPVTNYSSPVSQSLTLVSGGVVNFTGIYTALTCGNGASNYPLCNLSIAGECINGTTNPSTCDTCPTGFTFFNNACYACANSAVNYPTCTVNAGGQCLNGANDPVSCTTCASGQSFDISGVCAANAVSPSAPGTPSKFFNF